MEKELFSIRLAGLVFLIWVYSPIILYALVYFFTDIIFLENFVSKLLIPAVVLSLISFFISRIEDKKIKIASVYSIIGAAIWASPAIYFLPASSIYSNLNPSLQVLLVLLPSSLLALLFFYIGKEKASSPTNLSSLYEKKDMYSKQ